MYINTQTNASYRSQNEIRLAFPNTCFPVEISNEILLSLNIEQVKDVKPVYDPITEIATETDPVEVDGVWQQAWIISDKYSSEVEKAAAVLAELDRRKALKVDEINAARLEANTSTFLHLGKRISCDQLSRSDIETTNGIIAITDSLPDGWFGFWKTADNELLPINTVNEWKEFYRSMFNTGNSNFMKSQYLKQQVIAATTIAEVNAIAW